MQARIVPASRGARWLAEGWQMFRAAPLGWLALVFVYLFGKAAAEVELCIVLRSAIDRQDASRRRGPAAIVDIEGLDSAEE